ncbi:ABC transporter related [Shewanella halifaxensis HAW-EB4]|uniref:ABC transporter related n=1 Tax=Shewanella halifaxensis (strain HAW-EB4) TaxID=458817 RepID=B0TK67_SHEHH|nr:ATP-binding cassette domain-containing protein [Shewanella halifaxensis]ABZ77086.1 ABC transporter related [Shewanella halifaxensis HAW-EB4]
MLVLNDLVIQFGDKVALDIESLAITRGEKIAIIGRSGSGKSTLINHIYEMLRPSSALCSQRQGLVENLSVFHNVFMGALNRHRWYYNLLNLVYPLSQPLKEVGLIATELELDCPLTKPVSALSGGQRQRVALGRALYQHQELFIGDEPFSALDPVMGQRLLTHVLADHSTVVMVLHDMDMALAHFDRVIGLRDGRKVLDIDAKSLNVNTLEAFYQDDTALDFMVAASPATNRLESLPRAVKRY